MKKNIPDELLIRWLKKQPRVDYFEIWLNKMTLVHQEIVQQDDQEIVKQDDDEVTEFEQVSGPVAGWFS